MYDPEAQKWAEIERLRSSAFSRMGMAAVNYKGKLHMVSGVGVTYDPATGRWGDMPRGMKEGWSGQSVVVNGSLFMLDEPSGRLKVYNEVKDEWKCVTPKDDALKGMEQLVGGSCGTFCGIVRKKVVRGDRTVDEDAIRIVDVKGVKPAVKDVRLPFGRVVAVQVLSRMVL
ncbi:hypothetical protein KP509_12G025100 [Ceratopteris richardii]|nr:hypothetical protein KP509_12G025100 [Ceratopteris richardii]